MHTTLAGNFEKGVRSKTKLTIYVSTELWKTSLKHKVHMCSAT